MEMGLSVWADLVMDTVEVAVLGAVLWQLGNLRHDIGVMLRVVSRMDRKTLDTITSAYLRQAKADRAANAERAVSNERWIRSHR
jgi:hypothetical protein